MCYNKYCRLKKKESEIIFSNKINYCTKDIIKLFAVFIVALFTLFLIIFIKFEPVYEVKLGDETIGYVKSKEEIEKIINEELLKSEHECAVLSTLEVEPTYNLVLANKNLKNQEENEEDGFSLISYIRQNFQNINCICYSMFTGAGIVEKAISVGALGYVSKNADLSVLLKAMDNASQNKVYIEDSLTSDYIVYTNLFSSLTKREKELTELYIQGKNDEQIAQMMDISQRAINNYWTRILSKLGVASKKELIEKYKQ